MSHNAILQALQSLTEMVREEMEERRAYRKLMSSRYTHPKQISNFQFSLENDSLCDEVQPMVEVESCIIKNEIPCGLVSTHGNEVGMELGCKDLFSCIPPTIETPTLNDVHVDVCELGEKAQKVKTKACDFMEKESCEKMSVRDKHEINIWPIEKNERKANVVSLCEKTNEDKSILFSKQNIFRLLYKGTCYLTGELKPCLSSVSFEFLQEANELLQRIETKPPSKVKNDDKLNANLFIMMKYSKFASKFIHGSKHKVFKPGNKHLDLRTNPFKERGDDTNRTSYLLYSHEGAITRSKKRRIQEAYKDFQCRILNEELIFIRTSPNI